MRLLISLFMRLFQENVFFLLLIVIYVSFLAFKKLLIVTLIKDPMELHSHTRRSRNRLLLDFCFRDVSSLSSKTYFWSIFTRKGWKKWFNAFTVRALESEVIFLLLAPSLDTSVLRITICGHYVLYAEDHRSLQRLHKPQANSKKDEDNTVVRQK